MIKYKAIYKDNKDSNQIEIKNDFETLSFELDEFKFEGTSFDDFELIDYENHSQDKLKRFSFNKIPCGEEYSYEVCNYDLVVYMLLEFINTKTKEAAFSEVKILSIIGNALKNGMLENYEIQLSVELNEKTYFGKGDIFEVAANNLLEEFQGKYKFRNCFGCNFSDYSVYGQSSFGTMLCFKNQKKKYLSIKNKNQYMNLEREDQIVQETFLCPEFQIRGKNVGYRG